MGESLGIRRSVPPHPSIWMMGMLNQNTPESLCDYRKTSLAFQMFWNEILFAEQVWIIDTNPESVRRARTHYQFIYPFPKFHSWQPTVDILNRMNRIHQHTRTRTSAYEFQQWSTFYFDIHADAVAKRYEIPPPKIVAIVDADSQFQTFPTFQSAFPEWDVKTGGKEFKLRAFGVARDRYSQGTELLLGKLQVADFMVTFPVYVYLDTLKNLRDYVEKRHNMSFDDAFEKSVTQSRTYYSQFAIILSYAYWFEKHRYSFHIQAWPGHYSQQELFSDLEVHSIPQPRVSLHLKSNPKQALMKGCCFSYQLNTSAIHATQTQAHIGLEDWRKVSALCNSFGDYENHHEATCEYLQYPSDPDMHLWRQNDTMTKHYMVVASNLQHLADQSKNRKIMACVHYLIDPNRDVWFPHSSSGCTFS